MLLEVMQMRGSEFPRFSYGLPDKIVPVRSLYNFVNISPLHKDLAMRGPFSSFEHSKNKLVNFAADHIARQVHIS